MNTFRCGLVFGAAAAIAATLTSAGHAEDGDPAPATASEASSASAQADHRSLIDLAPQLYQQELRYPKFFGDPNLDRATMDGDLFGRQYLLGSLGGFRLDLTDNGIFVDFGVTQVVQSVVSGDSDDSVNYGGSADLWVGLDTGRAGLWPDGIIYTHFEGNWGSPVSGTGAILPLDFDATMPGDPASLALSEIYITQAISKEVTIVAGKANWAAFADTSFFANNERTQFLYTGLVNNAILGSFVPYTSWGAFGLAQVSPELVLGAAVLQNAGSATVTGFNDFSVEKLSFVGAAIFNPKIADKLPGSYQLLLFYSSNNERDFAIDRRYLLGEILGLVPTAEKDGNYALTVTATQYLWADEKTRRRDSNLVGFGPFLRFGIAPSDRNVIDQFYSVGIGGYGMIPGRENDNWGVGWAGSHISSDFRNLAPDVADLGAFEHAVEAFYNFEITPATHLTLDVQYVDPVGGRREGIVVLGSRLQLDF